MTYRVDGASSTSTLYVFAISRVGGERPSHTVSKSYADFVELNDALRAELNAAASANSFLIGAAELAGALPPLPPKSTIGRRKAAVIAERQVALTQYLLRTRLNCASLCPCSAAFMYHCTASALSSSTPLPLS